MQVYPVNINVLEYLRKLGIPFYTGDSRVFEVIPSEVYIMFRYFNGARKETDEKIDKRKKTGKG
jgi:hypothetical protein